MPEDKQVHQPSMIAQQVSSKIDGPVKSFFQPIDSLIQKNN